MAPGSWLVSPSMALPRLRLPFAAALLALAGFLAWRGEWPWRRLDVLPPIVAAEPVRETLDTLHRGETLGSLFERQGVRGFSLVGLPSTFSFDPRRLRAGLVFSFRRRLSDSLPSHVVVRATPEQRLTFRRDSVGWSAATEAVRWSPEVLRLEGSIDNSLYDALDAQISDQELDASERIRLAWDLADVYAWSVDFTRDIQAGDRYRVLVERRISDEGEVRFRRVLAGDLAVGGERLSAYYFEDTAGKGGYYDADGRSLRRAFLLAPLEFRRISSRMGSGRLHPILGTIRRHEGTDYAADPGTPVMAAADGTVERREWSGGYGNVVELRHVNGIVTRYGHLEAFAGGLRAGDRVQQGEVIGFVGSTGLATGPHLHYEFRVNGVARNPRSVDLGSGEPIAPAEREAFERERERLNLLLAGAVETPLAASGR